MQLELFQRNGVKKLENKIHIYELDCYKNATEEQKKRMRVRKDRYFDLEGLPSEEVRKLLEDFVWERGKKLAPSSLASEILYFNNIRNFLIEKNIKILRYEDENKIILQLKSWMMLQHRVMQMIRKNDIRDENGELLNFGTHTFRHCYGKKLTEMHIDDWMIARLLGHKTLQSVHHYRKIGNKIMADETRAVREKIDMILMDVVKEWDGYEI